MVDDSSITNYSTINEVVAYDSSSYADNQINTTVSGENTTILKGAGQSFNVSLTDETNSSLSSQTVSITINGVTYNRTTNDEGYAFLKINLRTGNYSISYSFNGNDKYLPSNGSAVINVAQYGTSIISQDLNMSKGSGQYYEIKLVDQYNNPIVNQNVYFSINGSSYTRVTDENGVARLKINLGVGSYPITVTYRGDGSYLPSNASNNINVYYEGQKTNLIPGETHITQGAGDYFVVTLVDGNNNTISSEKVIISVNGKDYTRTTNENGSAKLKINLKEGNYNISYVYSGNEVYNPASGSSLINVIVNSTHFVTNITKIAVGNGEYFLVTLEDYYGNVLTGENVVFNINGKDYTRTTDENGIAKIKINLKSGDYVFTCTYKGLSEALSTYQSYDVTVGQMSTIIIAENLTVDPNSGELLYGTLKDERGNVLTNQDVIFTIKGIDYKRVTDSDGKVNLTINLGSIGVYDVGLAYVGNNSFSSVSTNVTVVVNGTVIKGTDTEIIEKSGDSYIIFLYDVYGDPIPNKKVTITINGVSYNRTTNSVGQASVNINLTSGKYAVIYSFSGDSQYPSSSGSSLLTVIEEPEVVIANNSNAVWLFGSNMYNADLAKLASNGIGNIFLNFYAVESYGASAVESWIAKASQYGIAVHIWMQTFFVDGSWVNPTTASSSFLQSIIDDAVRYASLKSIAGIHLDYLRFPGTAYKYSGASDAITSLVADLVSAVKKVNPNIIVSGAVMPETTSNIYYYGQDIPALGKYLDVIVPMVYKGNYEQGPSWITSVTQWFKSNSGNAQVWIGLQSYASDTNVVMLSSTALKTDAQAAFDGGALGVAFFRYALTNLFNVSSIGGGNVTPSNDTNGSSGTVVSIAEILAAATDVKDYYKTNGYLPDTVKVGKYSFTLSQFLYFECLAIDRINSGNFADITAVDTNEPGNPNGDTLIGNLALANYLDLAQRTHKFIINYGQGPNYGSSTLGKVQYETMIEAFARILSYYEANNSLPATVSFSGKNYDGVDTSSISALSKSLTSGLTTDYEKAVALFNWVRDEITYQYYSNSRYYASGTLARGSANCCDQANLLVAIAREAGLTVSYRHHTNCYFYLDATYYGHVWVQFEINGIRYQADPCSTRNSFGKIVNFNYDTVSANVRTYTNLPF